VLTDSYDSPPLHGRRGSLGRKDDTVMINGPGKQALNKTALWVTICVGLRRQEGTP